MNKFGMFAGFALSALVAGPALAADMATRPVLKAPPPVAPSYSWSGCYVGAGGGYGMWNQDTNAFIDPGHVPLSVTQTGGGRGWFGTVQVGCDYQIGGNWVIGAFGDYDFSDIKGKPHFTVDAFGNEKQRSAWAAGARLGYVVYPQLLAFVSGGWTESRFNGFVLFNEFVPSTSIGLRLNAHTYSGWFVGTGYEYGLTFLPGLFWKTEYRYSDFKGADLPEVVIATNLPSGIVIHSTKFEQTIRSELVWRFNWAGPVRASY